MSQLQEDELLRARAADLADVPKGALALAGTTVALLLLAWLVIYFAVFIPRGPVG